MQNIQAHTQTYLALNGTRGAAVVPGFGAAVFVAIKRFTYLSFSTFATWLMIKLFNFQLTGCGCASCTSSGWS